MARYLDIHPDNPQPRLVSQVVEALRGAVRIRQAASPRDPYLAPEAAGTALGLPDPALIPALAAAADSSALDERAASLGVRCELHAGTIRSAAGRGFPRRSCPV